MKFEIFHRERERTVLLLPKAYPKPTHTLIHIVVQINNIIVEMPSIVVDKQS